MTDFTNGSWKSLLNGNIIDLSTLYHPSYPYQQTLVESWQTPEPHPDAVNPVLEAADVTDISASFVADPFIYAPDSEDSFTDYHMFFEIKPSDGSDAVMGHATSTDGFSWTYDQVVIDTTYHTAFPYVFRSDGTYYVIPAGGDKIPLWKASATDWPTTWTEVTDQLISGRSYTSTDTIVFRWDIDEDGDDEWVMLDNTGNTDLYIYYTEGDLETGSWTAHANNPVISGDQTQTRPCGRPIVRDSYVDVFYMDNVSEFGDKVRAWKIDTLTTSTFNQTEYSTSPILDENWDDWVGDGMHHYDPWWVESEGRWICSVDGKVGGNVGPIGIAHVPTITNNTVTEI